MDVMLVMTGKAFIKAELAAFAVGAAAIGGLAWICNKWEKSYNEARNAGVVA